MADSPISGVFGGRRCCLRAGQRTTLAIMTKHHFGALDGWRGIAALSVALMHFAGADRRATFGFYVPFFFVLSAFVLTHSLRQRSKTVFYEYAVRRLARLWPLHVLTYTAVPIIGFATFEIMRIGFALAGSASMAGTAVQVSLSASEWFEQYSSFSMSGGLRADGIPLTGASPSSFGYRSRSLQCSAADRRYGGPALALPR